MCMWYKTFKLAVWGTLIFLGVFCLDLGIARGASCSDIGDPVVKININGVEYAEHTSIIIPSPQKITFSVFTQGEINSFNGVSYPGGTYNYNTPSAPATKNYTTNLISGSGKTILAYITQNCTVTDKNHIPPSKMVAIELILPMSGSISASECFITAGNTGCSSKIEWKTINPESTSMVALSTNQRSWIAQKNSGTTTFSVAYGYPQTLYLYNNNKLLAQAVATAAACTPGTTWNGKICVAPSLPRINTAPISSITYNSAVSGGTVISDGGSSIVERGIAYNSGQFPTIRNLHTSDGSGLGSFTSSFTKQLRPNTTYYVRAYATNSAGTAYGQQETFTTRPSPSPRKALGF